MSPLIQLKTTPPLLITLALLCFGLLPGAQAVVPAPDGGYGPPAYGTGNTAEGEEALFNLSSGGFNTAAGFRTLFSNTTGKFNTAIGAGALFTNTGNENTATGAGALLSNTTGNFNTANGEAALFFNTTGDFNTALGASALQSNTTGNFNTAIGASALLNNTTSRNTAIGRSALGLNTTGFSNTANGYQALFNNTTGNFNIALGSSAGGSLTTGDSNIDIGNVGFPGESRTIRIGGPQTKTFIAGIRGVTTGFNNAVNVVIDANGQLGTMSSSRRYKKEIQPMDKDSEAILGLKPVTFHYKSDKANRPEFGLIAEEVAEVNPDLVVRDNKGEIYTVRYDAVNAMLLNEFLKERKKVEDQQETIAQLKSDATKQEAARIELKSTVAQQQKAMEVLTAQLKEQATQITKSQCAG
jgi:hypothetical protein